MAILWLVILTIGAVALIASLYFGKARNITRLHRDVARSERRARDPGEDIRRDPRYRGE